ncbi:MULTISPECIES: SRPBCC domain-containing protein [unclassified Micromonospora]|uniref:SRPBCC domain-containing protein n=1 Tax=unclassified Micromonospora TaxID=2617518 RepID=UPI00363A2845
MSTLRKRIRITAPPRAVHQALTDRAALRVWLAEHAEVELPHRYEFWGRFTPSGEAPRQRLRHVDDSSLRFDWDLDGVTTTVDIGLAAETGPAPEGAATLLTLTQTGIPGWPEVLTEPGDRSLMHTYWALALANLVDYAEGRDPVVRCDFTSAELRGEVLIDADRLAVYESLTEPEQFSRWAGVKVDVELHEGGRWAMGGFDANPDPARVTALRPGRSMSVDWHDMVQSWELSDSGGRTRLTFVQSGFDQSAPPFDGWLGWLGGLVELRRFHELKRWRPMWVEQHLEGIPDGLFTNT